MQKAIVYNNAVNTVRCRYCRRSKNHADFDKAPARYTGLHVHCKICNNFLKSVYAYRNGTQKTPPDVHPYMPGAEDIW